MNAGQYPLHEVVARFVRTEAFCDAFLGARAEEILGARERETLARLRPAAARRDYLAAHALARTMLAELTGSDPSQLRFHSSPWGRPEIAGPPHARGLRFSLSHADGVCLCAVAAGCDVGADVESLRNIGPDPLSLAEVVCSPPEMDALRATPAAARREHLLSIWTFKEAIAKATGLGFHFPPACVTIRRVGRQAVVDGIAGPWRLALSRLTLAHIGGGRGARNGRRRRSELSLSSALKTKCDGAAVGRPGRAHIVGGVRG